MAKAFIVLAAVSICGAVAVAQDTAAAKAAKAQAERQARVRNIQTELGIDTSMQFPGVRLQDALDYLSSYHKIKIVIDKTAWADAGVDLESTVDFRQNEISLAGGLNIMLRELDLTYVIEHEALMITTADAAQKSKSTQSYFVADLLPSIPRGLDKVRDDGAINELAAATALVMNEESSDLERTMVDEKHAAGDAIEGSSFENSRRFLHPRIRTFNGHLVIKASFHEHERIAALLGELRASGLRHPRTGVVVSPMHVPEASETRPEDPAEIETARPKQMPQVP